MSENKQPGKYDAVIGKQPQTPMYGAVVGGIQGLKQRFESVEDVSEKAKILEEALQYEEEGKQFIIDVLKRENQENLIEEILLKNPTYSELIINIIFEEQPATILKLSTIKIWNEFRANNIKFLPDFSNVNLANTNLSGTNLKDVDFSNANLSESDLSEANLTGTDLSTADLSGANLSESDLRGVDLRGADLSCVNLTNTYLLTNANLSYANLSYADLSYADLSCANLKNTDLKDTDLRGADLSYAHLKNANLSCSKLYFVNFTNANLSCSNLSYADLNCVNFTNADLRGADFSGAKIGLLILHGALIDDKTIIDNQYKKRIIPSCIFKETEQTSN